MDTNYDERSISAQLNWLRSNVPEESDLDAMQLWLDRGARLIPEFAEHRVTRGRRHTDQANHRSSDLYEVVEHWLGMAIELLHGAIRGFHDAHKQRDEVVPWSADAPRDHPQIDGLIRLSDVVTVYVDHCPEAIVRVVGAGLLMETPFVYRWMEHDVFVQTYGRIYQRMYGMMDASKEAVQHALAAHLQRNGFRTGVRPKQEPLDVGTYDLSTFLRMALPGPSDEEVAELRAAIDPFVTPEPRLVVDNDKDPSK